MTIKISKTIIWEGYEPVVTSQTTHQACTVDFEGVEPQEVTDEDLQIYNQITNNQRAEENNKRKSLTKSGSDGLNFEVKCRSKSEDFRDDCIGSYGNKNKELLKGEFRLKGKAEFLTKTHDEGSETLSATGGSDYEENKSVGHAEDDEMKLTRKTQSDLSGSTAKAFVTPNEGETTQKITFQEKIKQIKKTIYKDIDELVSKRRKRKFIAISTDEKKLLKFTFKYHPEFITKGQKIIINDSSMKAIGIIKDVIYIDPIESSTKVA